MFRAYCTSFVLAICMFALLIPCAVAQNTQHRVLYGQGVHAYYNGDYESAVRYLTATISKDTDDPRSYYFRGLANAKLGNDEASLADLKKGAAKEALAPNGGAFQVSTALQRIQGQTRLQIETLRKQARLDLAAAEKARLQARYEQQQRDEAGALRKPVQTSPSTPADTETTIRPDSPFAPNNIAGVESDPPNSTSSKSNLSPGINDKDPLGNVQGNAPTPAPMKSTAEADNNPFTPRNKPADENIPTPTVTPPANPAPAAPQDGGGGTLGSIFRSLNPFGGNSGNAEPNTEGTLDKLKSLIPGLGPAPAIPNPPPAPVIPAPGGNPLK